MLDTNTVNIAQIVELEDKLYQSEQEKSLLAASCFEYLGELYYFRQMLMHKIDKEMSENERKQRILRTDRKITNVTKNLISAGIPQNISI